MPALEPLIRVSDTSHSACMRPVLINHEVSGDTDNAEHILTDLTSVRLRETHGGPVTQARETLHWQLLGKWDSRTLSEKQLSSLSPPTSSRCLHALSALQKLQLLLSHLPYGVQGGYKAHSGSGKAFYLCTLPVSL